MFKNWFPKQQSEKKERLADPVVDLVDLQHQLKILRSEISEREIYRGDLERQILQSENQRNQLLTELDRLDQIAKDKHSVLEIELSSLQEQKQELQRQVDELKRSVVEIQQTHMSQPSKKLDENLDEFDSNKSEFDLDEPALPALDTSQFIDLQIQWENNITFHNNPDLVILKHINKYNVITEAEVSEILGNSRLVRKFVGRLEEYSEHLPFAIKVEQSASGSRYIKENSLSETVE